MLLKNCKIFHNNIHDVYFTLLKIIIRKMFIKYSIKIDLFYSKCLFLFQYTH